MSMAAGWVGKAVKATFRPERYRPWHAVLFWVAANGLSGFATGRNARDRRFYEGMRQAPFAPPAWAFVPVWTVNNISTLWGNLRLLNRPEGTSQRRALLVLQGASWLLYATFGYVYFRKGSPILALLNTTTMWLLTIASVLLSLKDGRRDVALSLGTLLAWLTLATPVATYQAVANSDELLGYRPRTPDKARG
jgi:tryptophan-rich sensory protein